MKPVLYSFALLFIVRIIRVLKVELSI